MPISFNTIPVVLRTPGAYTEYDASRAVQGIAALPTCLLLIGAQETGEATANSLQRILRKDDGDRLFGRGSQLSHMVQAAKKANPLVEMWAVGMADAGGATATTWTLVFSGTSTQAGSVYVYVAGRRVVVPIPSGTAAAAVGPLVDAALDLEPDLLFTSNAVTSTVTLTGRAMGAWVSGLDVQLNYGERETLPAGLSCVVTQTAPGATNPTVQTVLDLLPEDKHFTHVACGFADATNMTALEAWALGKWGPLVQQDVQVFVGMPGAYAALSSFGSARNSQFSTVMGAHLSPTPAHEWAAVVAAVDVAEPDPARPRQTLYLPNILPPKSGSRLDQAERNLLLQDGISTFTIDQSGKCYIERLITTYQTNSSAVADPTFLDITTMHTLFALRYTWNARIQLKYPRHKLASDGTVVGPGQPIVTPKVIRGEGIALFDEWAAAGLVEGSSKAQFMRELVVERNASDVNRVDCIIPPDLMNQLITVAAQIQFLL